MQTSIVITTAPVPAPVAPPKTPTVVTASIVHTQGKSFPEPIEQTFRWAGLTTGGPLKIRARKIQLWGTVGPVPESLGALPSLDVNLGDKPRLNQLPKTLESQIEAWVIRDDQCQPPVSLADPVWLPLECWPDRQDKLRFRLSVDLNPYRARLRQTMVPVLESRLTIALKCGTQSAEIPVILHWAASKGTSTTSRERKFPLQQVSAISKGIHPSKLIQTILAARATKKRLDQPSLTLPARPLTTPRPAAYTNKRKSPVATPQPQPQPLSKFDRELMLKATAAAKTVLQSPPLEERNRMFAAAMRPVAPAWSYVPTLYMPPPVWNPQHLCFMQMPPPPPPPQGAFMIPYPFVFRTQ